MVVRTYHPSSGSLKQEDGDLELYLGNLAAPCLKKINEKGWGYILVQRPGLNAQAPLPNPKKARKEGTPGHSPH